ncbi:hypothetical protein QTN47_26180 [Danxiaibacter flavus]|uniref:Uncharacterized protein n=1 Tax=Danxiaibacter flavus TaxID=3049108 RepID=A0ABV3ZQ98_9BACT|nr:hypothetical protein QNM32_26180 [Chitinophagaceae bacterium DXS]
MATLQENMQHVMVIKLARHAKIVNIASIVVRTVADAEFASKEMI